MCYEEKMLRKLIDSIQYDVDLFKIYIDPERYIMGYMSTNSPDNDFFMYKTIYDSILLNIRETKIQKKYTIKLYFIMIPRVRIQMRLPSKFTYIFLKKMLKNSEVSPGLEIMLILPNTVIK